MKKYKVTISISVVDNLPLSIKDYVNDIFQTVQIQEEHYKKSNPVRMLKYSIDKVEGEN